MGGWGGGSDRGSGGRRVGDGENGSRNGVARPEETARPVRRRRAGAVASLRHVKRVPGVRVRELPVGGAAVSADRVFFLYSSPSRSRWDLRDNTSGSL